MIAQPPPFSRAIIEVERAISDLRQGLPILVGGGGHVSFALSVESPETAFLLALLEGDVRLTITGARARALGYVTKTEAVALAGEKSLLAQNIMQLSDPLFPLPSKTALQHLKLQSADANEQAAVALCKLAALLPSVLTAPLDASQEKAWKERGMARVESAAIASFPEQLARQVKKISEAQVPLKDAPDARIMAFRAPPSRTEHLAVLVGSPEKNPAPLVRLHSSCVTGDLLGSLRCDCGEQLRAALRAMQPGGGILLYLNQEGRGIGIANKLRAYALQDGGLDTVQANEELGFDADERTFLVAAEILKNLGVKSVRLLTNNPAKVQALSTHGIEVKERLPLLTEPTALNSRYLDTKAKKCGHLF